MKSFQPKPTDTPPEDEDPDDPPPPAADDHKPDQPDSETAPMTRPARRDRSPEVDFRGEKRSNGRH